MGLINFFKRIRKKRQWEGGDQEEDGSLLLKRDDLNMEDPAQREAYVKNCCEQLLEAGQEVERAKIEYQIVTDYLTDMEELESLPDEQKGELGEAAKKLVSLDQERRQMQGAKNRMTDIQYGTVERFCEEFPDCVIKLQKDEEYQTMVNQDIHRLEGEKGALSYRKYELKMVRLNSRGVAVMFSVAVVITYLMLFLLRAAFGMDTKIGYILTTAIAAIAITYIFIRSTDASRELKQVERDLNRCVRIQNKIKIKYINITNLVEYTYSKYGVNSAYELRYLWDRYLEERAERERYQKNSAALEENNKELLSLLRGYHIKDPNIWLSQAQALIDGREMVEIRHQLIIRRQKLRKTMEYNTENMETAKEEVNSLIREYPDYAREILAIVSRYDG